MKSFINFTICVFAILFASCKLDNSTSSKVETGVATEITTESVRLRGAVNVDIAKYDDVKFGIMLAQDYNLLRDYAGEMLEAKILMSKDFDMLLEGLAPDTKYYYCAWVFLNGKQYEFGSILDFQTLAYNDTNSNYMPKAFSVSSSQQVYFSKGNLQFHPSKGEWRFAERQTDYIGTANNRYTSGTYDGWIDLFGWSTPATDFGVTAATEESDYYTSFIDWGSNTIGNDAPNTWRTLTYNEWGYLVFERPNASSLHGVARVNGVNGLILLPNDWSCPSDVTFKSGFHIDYSIEAYGQYQTIAQEQWLKMENAGAVFLPAAGYRTGSNVYSVQYSGYYWSAIVSTSLHAYCLDFNSDKTDMRSYVRDIGRSVRLVRDL